VKGGGFVVSSKIISVEEAERQAAAFLDRADPAVRPPAGELPESMLQRFLAQSARHGKEIERLRAENAALRETADLLRDALSKARGAWPLEQWHGGGLEIT
jgi:hypothetical protein